MNIASKIKVANSGPMAYNAPVTRKEFKDTLSEYDEVLIKITSKLEETNKINTLQTILDLQKKELEVMQAEINRLNKPKGLLTFLKNLF